MERPKQYIAVILRRETVEGRWESHRWDLHAVVPDVGGETRSTEEDARTLQRLFPGFELVLYRDEAEGYYLNVATPAPCWFVLWRMEEEAGIAQEPIPRPLIVTLSYNEAARWMDAQETVEQVPAPPHIVEWMRAFAEEHYVPEPKKRKRPESFRGLEDRFGQPASVTTQKKYGGGEGNG